MDGWMGGCVYKYTHVCILIHIYIYTCAYMLIERIKQIRQQKRYSYMIKCIIYIYIYTHQEKYHSTSRLIVSRLPCILNMFDLVQFS